MREYHAVDSEAEESVIPILPKRSLGRSPVT
jgi:hypothetical protein